MRMPLPCLRPSMMLALCLVVGVGCTKPTFYRPAANGFGYAEQKIGPDRYRVAFAGNHKTRRETAHQYALFRAAQLADQEGFSHVAVNGQSQRIERYGDLRARPTQRLDLGLEDGSSAADFGPRDDDNRIRSAVERYQAILDVTFYHDEPSVPTAIREIYTTDEVLKELGRAIEFEVGPAGGDYITNWKAE